jgi:cytoskeleton protein RodZ
VENSEQKGATPGEMLRAAREALGISSREMADRLNWMPTHLIAVEEDRFEVLRGTAFVRGYLRAYAKQVDIPESLLLAAFEALQAPELPAADGAVAVESESPLKRPEVGIALGLVCAVLLIAGLWWWQSAAPQKPAPSVTSVSEETIGEVEPEQLPASDQLLVVAAEQFAATEAALEESALEEAEAEVVEAEEGEAETPLDPVLDQPPTSPAEDAATDMADVEGDAMLQFRFSGDCWVEIRDGNDELIHEDFHRDGDHVNLDGLPPFNILLGDSTVVELSYQGEPVVITPRRGRVLARFTLGAP